MYDTYLLKVLILAVLNIFTHEGRLANRAGIHLTITYATRLLLITLRTTDGFLIGYVAYYILSHTS